MWHQTGQPRMGEWEPQVSAWESLLSADGAGRYHTRARPAWPEPRGAIDIATGDQIESPLRAPHGGSGGGRSDLNKRRVKGSADHPVKGSSRTRTQSDGEFDPGSGQTLAACVKHASRTGASAPV